MRLFNKFNIRYLEKIKLVTAIYSIDDIVLFLLTK